MCPLGVVSFNGPERFLITSTQYANAFLQTQFTELVNLDGKPDSAYKS